MFLPLNHHILQVERATFRMKKNSMDYSMKNNLVSTALGGDVKTVCYLGAGNIGKPSGHVVMPLTSIRNSVPKPAR